MNPEDERWLVCPVCKHANPLGKEFCQQCWGATLHAVKPVSTQEAEEIAKQWQAYLKHRKKIKTIIITLASVVAFFSLVFFGIYCFSDIIFKPPENVNSSPLPGEWAMFRHDLSHSGSTDPASTLPQGTVKWVFSTGASIHSSPAVADDTVYIGSRDGKLYALDTATGVKRWEYETSGWVDSSPAIVDGVVYIGSNDGYLYALDAQSGEELWRFKAKYGVTSSPAVADGVVYFGARDYYIYAVDTATGRKLWDYETNGYVKSSPVVANGIVYVGSSDGFLYALHTQSGRFRLHFKSIYPIYSSPAVSNGTIYFSNLNGILYAIDGSARNWPQEYGLRPYWVQLWAFGLPIPQPPSESGFLWGLELGITADSSPLVANDTLYIGCDKNLLSIDLQNYEELWKFETEGKVSSSPALANNIVYVGSEDGRLYAVDATTGEKLWDILTGDKITSSPAVADATVYIGSHDGNIYAIE